MFKLTRILLASISVMVLLGSSVSASAGGGGDGLRLGLRPLAILAAGLTHAWHSFHGVADSNIDARSVAVDADGNVYMAGSSDKEWGEPLREYSGNSDIVVMKLNAQGAYQWHTYYGAAPNTGSDGNDEAAGIAVDSTGNVYVTGYSDRGWNGDGNTAPLTDHGGDAEYMFILKLNGSGAYQWHTFFQPGRPEAIDVDGNDVYVAGTPAATWETPLHAYTGGNNLVVLKFNNAGAYQWHAYYGNDESTPEAGTAYGVIGDSAHNAVYVTGQSPVNWLGDGDTAPLHAFSGGPGYSTDIVVLKLNGAGVYQWHTFYGVAEATDVGRGIAVDNSGNLYIAGQSLGTWGTPLHAYTSESDIVALKLNSAGAYQWHTFYGSGGYDNGAGVAVDGDGNVFVAGTSAAAWPGDGDAQPAHPYSESLTDIVVLKLNASGAFQRHTFYGASSSDDTGKGIALSDDGVFVTGVSVASWAGDGGVPPIHPHSGNATGDTFILKLSNRVYGLYMPLVLR